MQRDAAEQLADGTFLSGLVTNLGESDPFIQSLRGAPQLLRRSNEMLRATLSDATRESDKLVHWLEGKSPQPSEQRGIDAVLRGLHLFLVDLGAAALGALEAVRAERLAQGTSEAVAAAAPSESPQDLQRRLGEMARSVVAAKQAAAAAAAAHQEASMAELTRRNNK